MPYPFITHDPVFVDNIGEEVFRDNNLHIQVRRIMYNGMIPVNIINSKEVLGCYTMNLFGEGKVKAMTETAGQSLLINKNEINNQIKQGEKRIWFSPFFGGRAFNLQNMYHKYIDSSYDITPLGLKVERVANPLKPTGWELQFWGGADNSCWDFNNPWQPLTSTQKNSLRDFKEIKGNKLIQIEQIIENLRKSSNHFDQADFFDGAYASGTTSCNFLSATKKLFEKYGIKFPKRINIFGVFVSGKSIRKLWEFAQENELDMHFTVAGAIISVRKFGILPFMAYTDLPPCTEKTMIFSEIYEYFKQFATNRDGKITKICSCGDVGTSLDQWEEYIIDRLIECHLFNIDPVIAGFGQFANLADFKEKVIRRVIEIESKHIIRLKTVNDRYLMDVVKGTKSPVPSKPFVF